MSWLCGPLTCSSLILSFLIVNLEWHQLPASVDLGGRRSPPCWQCSICGLDEWEGSALGPAEACVNKGCWARWVSGPLPGRGSPVRLFPPGGSRGLEQETLTGERPLLPTGLGVARPTPRDCARERQAGG